MEQKEFIKKVIKEADKRLERSDTLNVDEWGLYKDYPYVGVEDIRFKDDMDGDTNIDVDISEFLDTENICEAARKIIRQIIEYALTHTNHQTQHVHNLDQITDEEFEDDYDDDFEDDYDEDEYESDEYENYRD